LLYFNKKNTLKIGTTHTYVNVGKILYTLKISFFIQSILSLFTDPLSDKSRFRFKIHVQQADNASRNVVQRT